MSDPVHLDAFVSRHLELLDLERQAEIEEVRRMWAELPEDELERRGVTLRRLVVADTDVGLGGRVLVQLESSRGGELPAHRFAPGDVVALRAARERGSAEGDTSGVVASLRRASITVALDDEGEDAELPSLIRLDRFAPDVTFRRMRDALATLKAEPKGDGRGLREVLLGRKEPQFGARPDPASIEWFDPTLDASQRDAVAFTLRAQHLGLIHGPPGTGKTTAVVELILQAVLRGDRVLAVAPSNIAVDNLVERLATHDVRIVRIGHPARLLPTVREHALDAIVERAEDKRVVRELRRDIGAVQRQIVRTNSRPERRELRHEQRRLRAELEAFEDSTVRMVIDSADVVLATTTGAVDRGLRDTVFDLLVLDEAAQAIEAACWIPLHRVRRAVLVGDHRQLPPTVVSMEAQRGGLGRTLFERVVEAHGEAVSRMLTVQYRMHETIMTWSSEAMYDGRLTAADSVRAHLLVDLPHVVETPDTVAPFVLLDTAGCGLEESEDTYRGSRFNEGEAAVVVRHVENLLTAGVQPPEIAVITPYNAQVQILNEALEAYGDLEVGTVDGFQGREKEAVVLSLVRSNDRGEVGFLADARRLNVAVTRARRHVAVVGDSATLATDPFLAALVEYGQQSGDYRSAWDYQ